MNPDPNKMRKVVEMYAQARAQKPPRKPSVLAKKAEQKAAEKNSGYAGATSTFSPEMAKAQPKKSSGKVVERECGPSCSRSESPVAPERAEKPTPMRTHPRGCSCPSCRSVRTVKAAPIAVDKNEGLGFPDKGAGTDSQQI